MIRKQRRILYNDTYRAGVGKYPDLRAALEALIPACGEVKNPDSNPHLEAFRKATNCYHALYNNGLCNRRDEFASLFGIAFTPGDEINRQLVTRIERKMDAFILAAAKEQGIECRFCDPDDEFYARQQANEERAEERARQREINDYEPRQEH